jgi:hypothetical protein
VRQRYSWNGSKPPFAMRKRHLAHLPPKPGPDKNPMRLIGGTGAFREVRLPSGYRVDRSDPDVLVLRCPHGKAVARFSAWGATAEAIEKEARRHHRERNRSA